MISDLLRALAAVAGPRAAESKGVCVFLQLTDTKLDFCSFVENAEGYPYVLTWKLKSQHFVR